MREPGLDQGPVLGTLVGCQWNIGENPMSFIDSAFSKGCYLVSTVVLQLYKMVTFGDEG